MVIAGHYSNSPAAPSFHADAHSAASGVEDDSIAALADGRPTRNTEGTLGIISQIRLMEDSLLGGLAQMDFHTF
jgi:hypothetical protein